jgi:hypothetical protein
MPKGGTDKTIKRSVMARRRAHPMLSTYSQLTLIFLLFILDALVNFFTMYRNFLGCVDTNPDLISFRTKYGDRDLVTHHYRLSYAPS